MSDFTEKRRHRRHSARLQATAVSPNGLVRLATTIVNLSSSGAMLELAEDMPLGQSLTLLYCHAIEPCTVVWQQEGRAGVMFDAPVGQAA